MEAERARLPFWNIYKIPHSPQAAEIYVWNNSELVSKSNLGAYSTQSSFDTKVWQHAHKVRTQDMWLGFLNFFFMTHNKKLFILTRWGGE